MITIREQDYLNRSLKTLDKVDDTLIAIMKDYTLYNKYTIDFECQVLNYLDQLLNTEHERLIVTIYNNDSIILQPMIMEVKDLLISINFHNTIGKMYFEKGYLYIKLFNTNITYKINIVF